MKILNGLLLMLLIGLVVGCSQENVADEPTEEVTAEEVDGEPVEAEPVDSPEDNTIMTEEELLAIDGHTWGAYSEDEKFHAVSNFMYLMSENEGWSFDFTEMEYVGLMDDTYSDSSNLDKQFASLFIIIHTLEEE
jgi:hypothetical protein